MIHIDAVRRPAPVYAERGLSAFPDAITAAIDEERRRLFEELGTMYEGYFVLTVTYLPPLLTHLRRFFTRSGRFLPATRTEKIKSFKIRGSIFNIPM
jgi:type IV secretory pathway VirB4 component